MTRDFMRPRKGDLYVDVRCETHAIKVLIPRESVTDERRSAIDHLMGLVATLPLKPGDVRETAPVPSPPEPGRET